MTFTKEQVAYLLCTIYQELESGHVSTEKPNKDFVYLKTPVHGPHTDNTERPESVNEGAQWWAKKYINGNLESDYNYGFGVPDLPTPEGQIPYQIYQTFVTPDNN